MDVVTAIHTRRSTRRYSSKVVSNSLIEQLVSAAQWAPSAGNQQPLRIIIVDDHTLKQHLFNASGGQVAVATASHILVICSDFTATVERYGTRGLELYHLQDTAAAIQNILLTATALELATVWVGAFDERAVTALFDLPTHVCPVALIPVGYPADTITPHSTRHQLADIIFHNSFTHKYF